MIKHLCLKIRCCMVGAAIALPGLAHAADVSGNNHSQNIVKSQTGSTYNAQEDYKLRQEYAKKRLKLEQQKHIQNNKSQHSGSSSLLDAPIKTN